MVEGNRGTLKSLLLGGALLAALYVALNLVDRPSDLKPSANAATNSPPFAPVAPPTSDGPNGPPEPTEPPLPQDGLPEYLDVPELDPVSIDDAETLVLSGMTEFGYRDKQGREVVDVVEGEEAFLGVRVMTPEGRPVAGVTPTIEVEGACRMLPREPSTAKDGVMAFDVVGGQMGADRVIARVGEFSVEFVVNVVREIPDRIPPLPVVEGGVPWEELMKARVKFKEWGVVSRFPKTIKARARKTVKLSGFMVPLDPDIKQKLFILTSAPPSCYFHLPGGPSGSVEVTAKEGIAMRQEPIVVEGRFQPLSSSKEDIVYKLLDAHLVEP